MIRSRLFMIFLLLAGGLLTGLLLVGSGPGPDRSAQRRLVAALGLTDLALCSEARYTRHPSQADLFSAFQDYPGSYEHFPTGSLLTPGLPGFSGRVSFTTSKRR